MSSKKSIAEQYVKDVLDGKITTNKLIKLACERYVRDLDRKDIFMDRKEAERVIRFHENLIQYRGKFKGERLKLSPHQIFKIWNIFGWKVKETGFRRFKKSYYEVARKDGKTTLAAGSQLFALTADGEAAPQIYAAATKEDQAKIMIDDAGRIVMNTPVLKDRLKLFKSLGKIRRVINYSNGGAIIPLGSDSNRQDGFDPSFASIDEYHAHPDNGMVNVIESGTGARLQPFLDIITTAGFDKSSPCFDFRETAIKVLENEVEYDDLFIMIFSLDDGDSYKDQKVWPKSNPNLGITINKDFLKSRVRAAENEGSTKEVDVLTKNFNIWVDSAKTFIPSDDWRNLEEDFTDDQLKSYPCWGGLDLSRSRDLSAFVLLFELEKKFYLKFFLFSPEERKYSSDEDRGVPYDKWKRDGHLLVNEGNVIDYRLIQKKILDCAERYNIQEIAYDRYNATSIVTNLSDLGLTMYAFNQSIIYMNTPTKEFEKMILEKNLLHEKNPVMDWMMSNIYIKPDTNGNIKINREKSKYKVDGPIASVMAIGTYLDRVKENRESVYEERPPDFIEF